MPEAQVIESRTPEDRFREESHVRSALLAETEFKEICVRQADLLPISTAAKQLIKIFSYSMFDNAKVLGRLNYRDGMTVYIAVLKMRIDVNMAMAGVKPSDRRCQAFVSLVATMIGHYEFYLTRSADGWERGLQNEFTVKNKQEIEQTTRGGPLPENQDQGLGATMRGLGF